MILTDASVLIDYTRSKGTDAKLSRLFATLSLSVAGVGRSEVMAGARDAAERAGIQIFLDSFDQCATPEHVWDALADNLATLRRSGITVPFQDALLATIAIEADVELWARDAHFPLMQTVLPGLRLFAEPA